MNDATAILMCLSDGTLCEKLGEARFRVVAESYARAMHERFVDVMIGGRDLFARFTSLRPAGGFAPDPVRGTETSNEKHTVFTGIVCHWYLPLRNCVY